MLYVKKILILYLKKMSQGSTKDAKFASQGSIFTLGYNQGFLIIFPKKLLKNRGPIAQSVRAIGS